MGEFVLTISDVKTFVPWFYRASAVKLCVKIIHSLNKVNKESVFATAVKILLQWTVAMDSTIIFHNNSNDIFSHGKYPLILVG